MQKFSLRNLRRLEKGDLDLFRKNCWSNLGLFGAPLQTPALEKKTTKNRNENLMKCEVGEVLVEEL